MGPISVVRFFKNLCINVVDPYISNCKSSPAIKLVTHVHVCYTRDNFIDHLAHQRERN